MGFEMLGISTRPRMYGLVQCYINGIEDIQLKLNLIPHFFMLVKSYSFGLRL